MKQNRVRLLAYYLPQFHPIPENNEWWGNGFTEWTNVAKARPLFPGHYQPRIPADLSYYDLRLSESRAAQAELAHAYGIEGFCYYHYWFAGRRLLHRPFQEVLTTGEPDFPFCLCWANETWSGIWHGAPNRILIEQTYPGKQDDINHFNYLLEAFLDRRYILIEDKPVFVIYAPNALPRSTIDNWRELAYSHGLKGLYLIGVANAPWNPVANGYDAATTVSVFRASLSEPRWSYRIKKLARKMLCRPVNIFSYEKALPFLLMPEGSRADVYPCIVPNWDNSPRSGKRAYILHNSTPELFRQHIRDTLIQVMHKEDGHRIIFVKSWNEWAEGNYLEPDLRFGKKYLEVIKEEVDKIEHLMQ